MKIKNMPINAKYLIRLHSDISTSSLVYLAEALAWAPSARLLYSIHLHVLFRN